MSSYLDAPLIDEPSAPTVQDNPVGFLDNLFYGGQMADVGQQINQGLIPTGVPDQPQPKWMDAPLYDPEAEAQAKQQHLEDVRNQLATQDELAGKNLPQDQEKLNLYERAGLGFGQGLAGLGEAAGGAIEATQRLIAGKPPSGEYGNVGASLSRYSKAKSAELQDYGDLNPSLAGSVVQHLTAGITGMLPLVVGGAVAGVPAAMVTAGVQGFGSTYNKAKDAFEASGSTPDEAANGAYFPAILGGALSAVLMGNYFGKTGAEALRAGLTADTSKSLALAAMKHVGMGAGITGAQAIGDGIIEKATYNPNKSIGEIAQESALAALEGGALGGIMAGVPALARRTIPAVARAADRGLSRFAQTVDEQIPFAGPTYDPNIQPDARKISVPWLPDPNQPDTAIINQPPPVPTPPPAPVVRPPEALAKAKNAARKILIGRGVDESTANFFADHFVETNPVDASQGEDFRNQLNQSFDEAGFHSPREANRYGGIEKMQAQAEADGWTSDEVAQIPAIRAKESQHIADLNKQNIERIKAGQEPIPLESLGARNERLRAAQSAQQPQEPNATQEGNVQSDTGIQRAQAQVAPGANQAGVSDSSQLRQETPQEPVVFTPDQAQQLRSVIAPSMQGRAMEVPPSDLTDPNNAHLRHYLKQVSDAPKNATWADLAQTGLITLTPNEHGLIEIRYAPEQSPVPVTEQAKGGELQNGQEIQTQEAVKQGRQKASENVGQELLNPAPVVPEQVQPEPPTVAKSATVPVTEQSSVVSPVVAQPATTEPTLARKKGKTERVAKGETKGSAFARETALLPEGEDIISWIRGNAPMMSKTAFLKKNPGAKTASWDGASKLSNPSHTMAIYADGKFAPDIVAQAAYSARKIKEPTEAALWDAINQASERRIAIRKGQGGEKAMLDALASEHEDWLKATAKGEKRIQADDLKIGDTMEVAGEKVKVTAIDPDTNDVTLEDGRKFGKQTLTSGNSIHVEKLTEAESTGDFTPPEPVKQVIPKLAPGEKGTGDLLKNQTEDFALAGEKGVDYAHIQAEKEAAIKKAAEAKAARDKAQLDMFGKQGSLRTGQEPVPPGPARTATGRDAVKALVNDPTSSVPRRTADVINALMDEPALRDSALADKLTVTVGDAGKNFAATVEGNDIVIKPDIAPADFAQEIGHILTRALPKEYLDKIESDRQQALRENFGGNIPPEFQAGMSSDEFLKGIEAGRPEFTQETYPLSNFSEFMGTWFGEKYANEHFQNRNQGDLTVWQKVRKWFTGIADVLGRVFGRTPSMERMYREMLAGTHKTNPQEGVLFEAKQGAFVKSKEEAENELSLARTVNPAAVRAQMDSIHASTVPLMDQILAAVPKDVSRNVLKLLGQDHLSQINSTIINPATGPHTTDKTYAQVKARYPKSPGFVAQLAFDVAAQIANLRERWKETLEQHAEAQKQILSKSFLNKLDRLSDAEIDAKAAKDLMVNFETRMRGEIASALEMVKNEAGNAGAGTAILAQAQRGLESISAVRQAIHDQMEVLASDPAKLFALFQHEPNAQQLFQDYMQRKAAMYAAGTTNPPFDPVIVKWASETLAADKANLRKLIIGQMLQSNIGFKNMFNAEERRLATEFRDNPDKAVRELLKTEAKNVRAELTAREAWKELNSEVMKQLQVASDLSTAKDVIEKIQAKPEWVSMVNETAKDAGIQIRPDGTVEIDGKKVKLADLEPLAAQGQYVAPTADGGATTIDLTAENFAPEEAKLAKTIEDWKVWRDKQDALPENLRDPTYDFHMAHLDTLENILSRSDVVDPRPARLTQPWRSGNVPPGVGILENIVQSIGSRLGTLGVYSGKVFAKTVKAGSDLQHTYVHDLSRLQMEAAESMGFKKKGVSESQAATRMAREVMRPLGALGQDPSVNLHVGMVVGKGYEVTKEVLNWYRAQVEAAAKGFKIVQDDVPGFHPGLTRAPIIKSVAGKAEIYSRSMNASDWTLPSAGWNSDAVNWSKGYGNMTQAQKNAAIADNFDLIESFIRDRKTIRAQGQSMNSLGTSNEPAYAKVSKEIQDLNLKGKLTSAERNLDWVANEVAAVTGEASGLVKEKMLAEIGKVVDQFNNKRNEPDLTETHTSTNQGTSFTKKRTLPELPDYFQRYGFHDAQDFMNFTSDIHVHAFNRLAENVDAMVKELEAQKAALDVEATKLSQETGLSKFKAGRQITSENKKAVAEGKAYRQLEGLNRKINRLKRIFKVETEVYSMGQDASKETIPGKRVFNALTGGAMTGFGSLINNASNIALVGLHARNMSRVVVQSDAKTLINWLWDGATKQTGAYLASLPAVAKEVFTGHFGNAIHELVVGSQRRVEDMRYMQDHGMVPIQNPRAEWLAKKRSPSTGGLVLPEDQASGMEAKMGVVGTLFDMTALNPVIKGIFPTAGDNVQNTFSFAAAEDTINELGNNIRRIFANYKDGNAKVNLATRFDATNPQARTNDLTHHEMFAGTMMGGVEERRKMAQTLQQFQRAGLDFQQVAKGFIHELRTNPKAEFMTDTQRDALRQQALFDYNVPNAVNRNPALRKGGLASIVGALQGFNIFNLGKYGQFLSRPTTVPGSWARTRAWMITTATVVPALAVLNVTNNAVVEDLVRKFYHYILGKERNTRQPWEQDGTKRQVMGFLLSAVNPIPIVNSIANTMINDMPGRGSYDMTPMLINKGKQIAQYVGGVLQTGDPTYGLNALTQSLLPWTGAILNRLPEQQGLVEMQNAAALLRRYGPTDALKPSGGPSVAVPATELSPFIRAMEGAMGRGDIPEFTRLKEAAEAKAVELGKDPNTIKASFEARNPYSKVFTGKLTDDQRQAILDRMSDSERKTLTDAEQKFSDAHDTFGTGKEKTFTVSQEQADKREAKREDRISNFQSGMPSTVLSTLRTTERNPGTSSNSGALGRAGISRQPSSSIAGLSRLSGKVRKVRLAPIRTGKVARVTGRSSGLSRTRKAGGHGLRRR